MNNDYKNDYIVKKVYISFLMVSIFTALAATIGVLIDNIIVGQFLGTDALSAMGVVSPVSLVLSALGNICSGGGVARASQAIGKGQKAELHNIFTVTMLFVVVSGVIMTILGFIFAPQIAVFLGANDTLLELSTQYLRGFFLGSVPTIMLTALMGFIKIDGSSKMPLICILVMTCCNILLDLAMVLIFKKGMFGVALATTISYCIAVAVGCLHFTKKINTLRLAAPKKVFHELRLLVTTGAPTAISRICETLRITILNNILITAVGVSAVAALSVRTQISSFAGALVIGIGQAAIPVTGMFFGEEDKTSVRDTFKTTIKTGFIITCVAAVIIFVCPSVFLGFLGVTDNETVEMASRAIRLFAIGMPISLLNMVFMNFYQSTRKTGLATLICVLQSFAYTVLFALILIQPLKSDGIWIAFLSGEILTLATVVLYVTLKNRKFSIKPELYMLLDRNFGKDRQDCLEISIGNDMDEVMKISSGIYKFGQNRAVDKNTLNAISLCIEEMAGNVVRHAFKPGEKKWFDLIILNKENAIIIRMRDNGAEFDPLKYINGQNDIDEDHLGIKMILGIADKLEYRRTLGLNNLIITLNKNNI